MDFLGFSILLLVGLGDLVDARIKHVTGTFWAHVAFLTNLGDESSTIDNRLQNLMQSIFSRFVMVKTYKLAL